jgi:hypothetical protein
MSDYLRAYTAGLDTQFNQAILEGNFSEAVNHTALSTVYSQRESEKLRHEQNHDLREQREKKVKDYIGTFSAFGANANSAVAAMQTFAPLVGGVPSGAAFGAAVNGMKGLNDEGTQAVRIGHSDSKDVVKEYIANLDRETQRSGQAIADAMAMLKEANRAKHDAATNMLR